MKPRLNILRRNHEAPSSHWGWTDWRCTIVGNRIFNGLEERIIRRIEIDTRRIILVRLGYVSWKEPQ